MADYLSLKEEISQYIKTNNNEEITGEVLQQILLTMVASLGSGYQVAGIATPETQVETPDERMAWVLGAGTYSNFGDEFEVKENEFGIVLYDEDFRVYKVTVGRLTDEEITEDSRNPVESAVLFRKFASIQQEIDEIISGAATVTLSASPTAVFADGTGKNVNFTAASSPTPAKVTFKEKDSGGEGETVDDVTSHVFQVVINSEAQGTKTYQAAFEVAGVSKGVKEASVKLVYQVFVGAGADYEGATFEGQTARPTPAGEYDISTHEGDHLMFDVPSGMSISRVQLYDNPDFPTDVAVTVIQSSRTGLDGSEYVCYQSVGTFAEGTHRYKVS